ncbi:MAG: small ribosomal subunit biogenesis GTPase RsgA [Pseudomonadales bacterium]|nr:small ribosomal subunit biogenesis GTPase RsgA [Pseudomonadales bacterium]
MSKRRLTRQQQWRIDKVQQERIARAQKKDKTADTLLESGEFGSEQDGTIVAHYGTQVEVEDASYQRYRCLLRANVPQLVTGDRVVWRPGPNNIGIIEAQYPRRSSLSRPDMRGKIKTVAANVDYIIIVIAPLPAPSSILIDRYLVAAELADIEPIVLLNKIDLLDDNNRDDFERLIESYQQIGYKTFTCSATHAIGLTEFDALVHEHSFVFVGQSGVGKSSLVNALLPDDSAQETREVSESSGLGVHTTTTAKLFHTMNNGKLIDSPGIREFSLHVTEAQQLARGFREFQAHLGHCRFNDCKHDKEPKCAIKTAVEEGKISLQRLQSYRKLVAAL